MPLPPYSLAVPAAFEKQGSPTEEWSDAGLTATATLVCPWASRYTLVDDLLEHARPYPHRTDLFAVSANITPLSTKVNQDGQCAFYETAEITVQYGVLEFTPAGPGGPDDVQIYAEELTPNGEFITIGHKPFVWESATGTPLTPEEAPGKLIMSVDFVQTQYNMTVLHMDLINLINCTNNAAKTAAMLGLTFPIDSLLYAGASPSRSITTGGVGKWTVAKKFCFRKDGWNKFWKPDNPDNPFDAEGFFPIFHAGGNRYYNFPLANLNNILL